MLAMLARRPGIVRVAAAGLGLGLLALAGVSVWSTATTERAIDEIAEVSAHANRWSEVLTAVVTEDDLLGDYLRDGDPADVTALEQSLGSARADLEYLLNSGDAEDRSRVVTFESAYAVHTAGLRQLLKAVEDGDTRTAELLRGVDERRSNALRDQAEVQHSQHEREVASLLADLIEQNRRIAVIGVIILGVDVGLLAVCCLVLFSHQRRVERQAAENLQQALHDGLTGVANRVLLMEQVDKALAAPGGQQVALLLVDLDRFKEVNDTLGHHVGDLLLVEVTGRLTALVRPGDTVARLGGDEFAVLLPGVDSEETAVAVGRRMLEAFSGPAVLSGTLVSVGGSIGIALCPAGQGDPATAGAGLLQHADIAMYRAKRARIGLAVFREGDDAELELHLTRVDELRRGIRSGELLLHYLPKATTDGELTGAEALVRWQHPQRGLIAPADFVPLAETGGLIDELTDVVLEQALADQAAWRERGLDVPVWVNLAAPSLISGHLRERLLELFARHGTPPGGLGLEITEAAMLTEPARATAALEALRGLGLRVALDDFGTGHSSMSHLLALPLDELKVDRSFVVRHGSSSGRAVIRAVVELGHALGLSVVAEGVEDAAAAETLRAVGCDQLQGYFVRAPGPRDEIAAWLSEQPRLPRRSPPAPRLPTGR